MMNHTSEMDLFAKAPVPQAVLKNALPAIAATLMVLIYNLADTFFIGQTHNDLFVASVALTTPVFLIFTALGIVFGIGGTSMISRALGGGRTEYANQVCSFCMWGCVVVGIVLTIVLRIFMSPILTLIGASADTWEPSKTYLSIVTLGGPLVLISGCYSNIIRAEGRPGKAMAGQFLGNLINIILDPILILGLGWDVAGAAVATVIGNLAGAGYYILYFLRGKSTLSVRVQDFSMKDGICTGVLAIGIPASMNSLLMSLSQILVNAQMSNYDDMALAGIGVAMKITMITSMICIGLGQGIQPLLGYCFGAKLWERFRDVMKFSLFFALGLGVAMTGLCYLLRELIIGAFLTESVSFEYAVQFTGILLTTSSLFGVFFVLNNSLQAMGAATQALIPSIGRQGLIYIPALFALQAAFGMKGLVWAQPVADTLSIALAVALYLWTSRRLMVSSI